MDKHRFYIDTSGNDDDAYREAIAYAYELAKADPEIKRIILLIHTKSNSTLFERLFNLEIAKKLLTTGIKAYTDHPLLKGETKKTYSEGQNPSEIVITCGFEPDDIFRIDDFDSVKAIIAIPWLKDGIKKWVQTWAPTELRSSKVASIAYPEPPCIVKKAMQHLTDTINLSTGLNHATDEEYAKTCILALHANEAKLDENAVGSYLISKLGWETKKAREVEKLIGTLNAGRQFKGGDRSALQDRYNQWKKECEE